MLLEGAWPVTLVFTGHVDTMPSCYDRLCNPKLLRRAWTILNKTNKSSHGFDRETIRTFAVNLDENIKKISAALKSGNYQFIPLRAKPIPKEGGGVRILRIPAVRDRVVLTALKLLIAHRFDRFDRPCSYGYIRGRSRFDAIAAIRQLASSGHCWVLEADMKKFFDTVPRKALMEKFVTKIRIPSIAPLVERAINVEVGNLDQFNPADQALLVADSGIPQGGVLSPMLANFYLSPFDQAMEEAGYKLIRYADDFVVMCRSQAEALSAYKLCVEVLERRLCLTLHHIEDPGSKSRVHHFSQGFTFLGVEFRGDRVLPSRKSVERFKSRLTEILEPSGPRTLLGALSELRNTTLGWGDANKPFHSTAIFQAMDELIRQALTRYLRGRGFLGGGQSLSRRAVRHIGIPSLLGLKQRA